MLEIALTLLLSVHLLLVDLAMMGPLACVWLEWRGTRQGDAVLLATGRRLLVLTIWALIGGSGLGFMMLLARYLAGEGGYLAALGAIPRDRLWFGLLELLFALGCLGVYLATWNRWQRHRVWHRLLAVAAATNLLVHFPALFSVVSVVNTRVELAGQQLGREAYRRLLVDAEVLSRVAHVWLAAVAVTGVVLMGLGARLAARGQESESSAGRRCLTQGALAALAATLLQFPVGIWVALAMPEDSRERLLGGDVLVTLCFGASLALALLLMHLLSATAQGAAGRLGVRSSAAVIVVLTVLMVGTRLRLNELAAVPFHRGPEEAAMAPLALASRTGSASIGCPQKFSAELYMEWLLRCPWKS